MGTQLITFTSPKRPGFGGEWSRTLKVGDQEYSVSLRRGNAVRIPFKPRGRNRGWQWHGVVYRIGANSGHVWSGRVPGSLGCYGILVLAEVLS